MERLRAAGYTRPFTSLEAGVGDYVRGYLAPQRPLSLSRACGQRSR